MLGLNLYDLLNQLQILILLTGGGIPCYFIFYFFILLFLLANNTKGGLKSIMPMLVFQKINYYSFRIKAYKDSGFLESFFPLEQKKTEEIS